MILIVGQNAAWQKVCVIPKLARGEVNRIGEVHTFASSKGPNAARALACIGGEGEVICYVGGGTGELFRESLRKEGIRVRYVGIKAETRTCTTLAEPDGPSTELIEPAPVVTTEERDAFRRVFLECIGSARVLIISGTSVSGESADCYGFMTREARSRGKIVILDSACPQARNALRERPEILKINQRELGEISGRSVDAHADRISAFRSLSDRFGIRWFLISRGPEGMEGFDGRTLLHAGPPAVNVVNSIGSGDAATAGAGWAVHQFLEGSEPEEIFRSRACLEETLRAGTAMGTANCLNPVNGKVDPEDLAMIRARIRVVEIPFETEREASREKSWRRTIPL